MLDRITANLSDVYSNWKTRALALGAAATLFLMTQPGCAVLEWPFTPHPDRKEEQKVFFKKVDDKTIDKVCGMMIKDFQHVGEIGGKIHLKEDEVKFSDKTDYDDKGYKASARLRNGKYSKGDLDDIRAVVETNYSRRGGFGDASFTRHRFIAQAIDNLKKGKDPGISNKYLADLVDEVIDGYVSAKWTHLALFSGLPRFIFHLHPEGSDEFSKPDHFLERLFKTTQFVFCYTGDGNLTVVYSEGNTSKKKKFKIKDPEKVFQLELLTSMNFARNDTYLVFTEDFDDDDFGEVKKGKQLEDSKIGHAVKLLNRHSDRADRKEYKTVINYVAEKILERIDYMNRLKKKIPSKKSEFDDEISSHYLKALVDLKDLRLVDVEYLKRVKQLIAGNMFVSDYKKNVIGHAIRREEVPVEVKRSELKTMDDIRRMAEKDGIRTMDDHRAAENIRKALKEGTPADQEAPWRKYLPLLYGAAAFATLGGAYGLYRIIKNIREFRRES